MTLLETPLGGVAASDYSRIVINYSKNSTGVAITEGKVNTTISSVTINAPTAWYVIVNASCTIQDLTYPDNVSKEHSWLAYGFLSQTAAAEGDYTSAAFQNTIYERTVTMVITGGFAVSAGANTFYFNGRSQETDCDIIKYMDVYMTAIFSSKKSD